MSHRRRVYDEDKGLESFLNADDSEDSLDSVPQEERTAEYSGTMPAALGFRISGATSNNNTREGAPSGFENNHDSSLMNPRLVSSLGATAMNAHLRASPVPAAVASGYRQSRISTALAGKDDKGNSSSSDNDDERYMTHNGRIAQKVHQKAPNLLIESGKSISDDSSENWDEFIKSLDTERKPLHTLRSSIRSSIAATARDKPPVAITSEHELEMNERKMKEEEEDTLHARDRKSVV